MTDTSPPLIHTDPRETLAKWANDNDEWVRRIVKIVLATGQPVDSTSLDEAYVLFRQEKSLDKRTLPLEPKLVTETITDDKEEPLVVIKVSDVHGVNAIVPGSIIEPHEGLTILYGENGTGKTGYARIFKALAASRTADTILSNVDADKFEQLSAKITYKVGDQAGEVDWHGENGRLPFTRMSIFDSRAVTIHVDDDIEYVYTPAVLALFEFVVAGLRGVQDRVDIAVRDLRGGTHAPLLSRFPRESSVYPFIETLGAASDLEALRNMASTDPKVDEKIEQLRATVAALEADTFRLQIAARHSAELALDEAVGNCKTWTAFDAARHKELIEERSRLRSDYRQFRTDLFASADLPTEPEESWESFVRAGAEYQQHLEEVDVHDDKRCLYCRQELSDDASQLIKKYGQYIDDKISDDLAENARQITAIERPLNQVTTSAISGLIAELAERKEEPTFLADLQEVVAIEQSLHNELETGKPVGGSLEEKVPPITERVTKALTVLRKELANLLEQSNNRVTTLADKRQALHELVASAELARSWTVIEGRVRDAKEADRLAKFSDSVPNIARAVTTLSKEASNELINNSFEELFLEECRSLRAPQLKLQFMGRDGKAQRRKMIGGKHKPSKVFSEGEQKVLAIADFLAEARLAGIAAPVIFDDPVSSLDYRRIDEVAERVASLADETQVIVFTHDILFATKLLSLFEVSKRCTYLHVTDEGGAKGKITRASGPRWDSLSKIKGKINDSIQKAEGEEGEARAAHIRTAYDWVRSWCEVFIEQEVLQGVTQRLQPNVSMGRLVSIKTDALPGCFATVTKVFDDACRYIDGHSQPLATLAVAPTLDGLKADWQTLQDCKKTLDSA